MGYPQTSKTRHYILALLKEWFEDDYEETVCPDIELITEAGELAPDRNGRVSAPYKGLERPFGGSVERLAQYCDDICFAFGSALFADRSLAEAKTESEFIDIATSRERERFLASAERDRSWGPARGDAMPNYDALGV